MSKKLQAQVIAQQELAAGIYDLRLSAPEIAAEAHAGQFINVYCGDKSRLLPRPISLAGIDAKKGELRLIYRVSGAGTEEFSHLRKDDTVEVLGPLGNGFPVRECPDAPDGTAGQVFLIGGGIGIPPLLETAKRIAAAGIVQITAVLGYRDGNTFLADEFKAVCGRVLIASEDGSAGTRGTVLDAMREAGVIPENGKENTVQGEKPVWFACGPTPMLRALKACAAENGIPCWISLEERMACGVGACLACVCKTTEKDEHSQVKNRRICKDGPVFRAEEIEL